MQSTNDKRIKLFAATLGLLSAFSSVSAQETGSGSVFTKYRVGGYGEMVANFMNYGKNRFTTMGSARENRATIAIPRFVLAGDYKFTPKITLGAEIEFEYGGVGTANEIEWYSENGEYENETENGGATELEQFHITFALTGWLNIRAGHMVLPMGLTNSHHEPIFFFGTSRPEGETTLMPCTWHETGVGVFGQAGAFGYEAMVTTGLNPNGFGRQYWIKDGKQGAFETDNFSAPAVTARLEYSGVKGLRIGTSYYWCGNAGKNADKPEIYKDKINIGIVTGDIQYTGYGWTVRANADYGFVSNTLMLNNANKNISSKSEYSKTSVAKNALTYGAEAGYDITRLFPGKQPGSITPFLRYEYYNPMESTSQKQVADKRLEVNKWTVGANWNIRPNLVLKADYTIRRIGGGKYNRENEFGIGLAYIGWFAQK